MCLELWGGGLHSSTLVLGILIMKTPPASGVYGFAVCTH